jgi:hypothetical protein
MFKTIAELKAANKAAGMHFFDRDTMRFWKSRIETQLFANQCFVTSEDEWKTDGTPGRVYCVRRANTDASMETVRKHMTSRSEAITLAKSM